MVNRKIDSNNNDTEGHSRKIAPEDKSGIDPNETEGHGISSGRIEQADTKDAEGHLAKGRP